MKRTGVMERRSRTGRLFAVLALAAGAAAGLVVGPQLLPAHAETVTKPGKGYWFVASDGGIFSYGDARFHGSAGGSRLNAPIVGMAATPSGKGYWFVASDGGMFSYGDARFFGSMGGAPLNAPIVGMAPTASGNGYWLVARDGGIFSFGDARFLGSMGGTPLNAPIVGMAATRSGNGYWFVAADGGIFSFGDARFFGSMGGTPLNAPIVGMAATPSGNGYWFVGADGGIFSFGGARFFGSAGGSRLNAPIVGMAATPVGNGYWFVASDGGIFSYGDATFYGSAGGARLNAPVVGMAPTSFLDVVPVARDDARVVIEGAVLDVAAPGVLANDSDADGDALRAELVSGPANGTLSLHADGSFTYTPKAGFAGADSFVYRASDGFASDEATVSIRVDDLPSLAVTGGPASGSRVNDATPTFSGAAADADGKVVAVQAALGAGNFADVTCTGCGTGTALWTYTHSPALADGAHTLRFRAVDDDGAFSPVVARTFTVDTVAPTVTVEQKVGQADPTRTAPVEFTVTFSESVSGFAADDVQLAGNPSGATSAVTGSGAAYTLAVTPGGDGAVVPSIPAGKATDAAGNQNAASTSSDGSVLFDATAPTFASVTATAGVATVRATFDEPVLCSTVSTSDFAASVGSSAGDDAEPVVVTGVACAGTAANAVDVTLESAPAEDRRVQLTVVGAITDPAGNPVALETTRSALTNATPAVAITGGVDEGARTNDATPTFSGTATDTDGTVSAVEAAVDGGAFSTAGVTCTGCSTANATWSYTPTVALADGVRTVTVRGVDGAGARSVSPATRTFTVDTGAPVPVVTAATSQASPTNASPVAFTVAFGEAVTGFGVDDLVFGGSAPRGTPTISAEETAGKYTVSVPLTEDGDVELSVVTGAATDTAGNSSLASTGSSPRVVYDITPSAVTVEKKAGQADPTNGSSVAFTVTFEEPTSDFTVSDVELTGSAGRGPASVTGMDTTYTVTIPLTDDGDVVLKVPAGVAHDAAGNGNAASTSTDNSVVRDTDAPDVTVEQASAQPDPTNDSPITFTVTFSEAVTGFTAADVDLSGSATWGTPTVTGPGPVYDVSVPVTAGGTVVASVDAGKVSDTAGNANTASTSDDATVTYDVIAPVFNAVSAENGTSVVVASFSEDLLCSTVAASDFTATIDSEAVAVTGAACTSPDDDTVELTLAHAVTPEDVVAVSLVGVVSDPAGNEATPRSRSVTANALPTVAVAGGPADDSATNDTTPTYTGTAGDTDGTVTTVEASIDSGEFSTAGVTCSGCGSASATWTFTPETALSAGPHNVRFRAVDDDGDESAPAASRDLTVDLTKPGVTVDKATTQADPTATSPVRFVVVFDEAVTGFAVDDLHFGGTATRGAATVTPLDATEYEVAVAVSGKGTVSLSVDADKAIDAAGNGNAASTHTDNVVDFDGVAPTVTVEKKVGQADPTNTSPVRFAIVFDEDVDDFVVGDVTLAGGATRGTPTLTGGGGTYELAVPLTGNGDLTVTVAAGVAHDPAGNANVASTSTDNTVMFDTRAPAVTVEVGADQDDPTNGSSVVFDVAFDETVTGFGADDVVVGGNAARGAHTVAGNGSTYTVTVPVSGDGTVTATVGSGAALDDAGNGNAASTSTDNEIVRETVRPNVTVEQAAAQSDPTNDSPVLFTVTFTEAVSGFTAADVLLGGSAGRGTPTVTGGQTVYTVSVPMTSFGTVTASLGVDAATDTAGNTSLPSTSTDNEVTFDTVQPTFDSVSAANGGSSATAHFSEKLLCSTVAASDFVATVDGLPTVVDAASCDDGADDSVVLTLDRDDPLAPETVVRVTLSGVVTDRAGNEADRPTMRTVTTNELPTIAITGGPADDATTNDPTPTYSGTADDDDGVVDAVEASVDGGAFTTDGVTCTDCGSDEATWTFTPATPLAAGTHSVQFRSVDDDEDPSTPTSLRQVTIDLGSPGVAITKKAGQADPTKTSPVAFTITFTEGVSDFVPGDVTLSGSAARGTATLTGTAGGATYELSVPLTADGEVTATIDAGKAHDSAGNPNTASTSPDDTILFDTMLPTFTSIEALDDDPTVTATFSEPLLCTSVAVGDFAAAIAGEPVAVTSVVCSDEADRTVDIVLETAPTTNQSVLVSLTGEVTDPAGNAAPLTQRSGGTNAVPTVAVGTPADNTATNDTTPTFTGSAADTDGGLVLQVEAAVGTAPFTTTGVACTGCGTANATWSYTVPAALAEGVHVVHFRAIDDAGKDSAVADRTITIDVTSPRVTVTGLTPANGTTKPIVFNVAFDEVVTGFGDADVTVSGTAFNTLTTPDANVTASGSGKDYTVTIANIDKDGTIVLSVPAGGATDAAGNGNTVSNQHTITRDTVAPTTTVSDGDGQADPTNGPSVRFKVVFNETVTGFGDSAADVTVTGASGAPSFGGAGTTYEVTVPVTTDGTISLVVPAGAAQDAATNGNAVSGSGSVVRNTVAPVATVTADTASPTDDASVVFSVDFNETVTFPGPVTVGGNATTGTPTISGTSPNFTVTIPVTGDGDVTLALPAGAATDTAGNGNVATAATPPVTVETSDPTVTITGPVAFKSSTVTFTVTFSEPVSGFSADDDVTVDGTAFGTLDMKDITITPSGDEAPPGYHKAYSVVVGGMSGQGTVTLLVPTNKATDTAGNPNQASSLFTTTRDTIAPTTTVSDGDGQADPTNGDSVRFKVVFNQTVTGFGDSAADVTTSGPAGAVSFSSTSGTVYEVTVVVTGDGTIGLVVPAGAAQDAATNNNASSGSAVTIVRNTVAPVATITADTASPTDDASVVFSVDFNETVTFPGPVTVGGNATTGTPAISGTSPNFTVTIPVTGDGDVTLALPAGAATDTAGNPNAATAATPPVTVETSDPGVTITGPVAFKTTTVNFTVAFTEAVTGFGADDDVTVGGTAFRTIDMKDVTITASGTDGTTYNVAVGGMGAEGTVTLDVPANKATDTAGNPNQASSTFTSTRDTTAPTTTVSDGNGQADPTNGSSVRFKVVFNETVTGFGDSAADVTVTGASGAPSFGGAGTTYEVTVPVTTDGTISLVVPAGAAQDAATNGNAVSGSGSVVRNTVAPVATVTADTASPTDDASVVFSVDFNETVTFPGPVTVGGNATTGTPTISGTSPNFTVTIPVTGDGDVTLALPAGAATDTAGNGNVATAATPAVTVETSDPEVVVSGPTRANGTSTPIVFTVTFTEPVTGFADADVTVSGTAFNTLTTPDPDVAGSGKDYTVTIANIDKDGTIVVSIAAGRANDTAGNGNLASNQHTITRDTVAPTATVTLADGQATPTTDATVRFKVTFSEVVTGFDNAAHLTLTGTATRGTPTFSGAGDVYEVTVPLTSDGTVSLVVPASAAADLAGNGSAASGSAVTITRDITGPALSFAAGTVGSTAVTTTFSEAVVCASVSATDFIATVGGSPVSVAFPANACSGTSDSTIDLTLGRAPTEGERIVLTLSGAVEDGLANQSLRKTVTSPTITVTTGPAEAGTTMDLTPTYGGAVTSGPSTATVKSVTVKVDTGSASSSGVTVTPAGAASATWSYTPTSNLSPGSHTFTFTVTNSDDSTMTIVRTVALLPGAP